MVFHFGIFFMGTGFTSWDLATLQYPLTNYIAAGVHHASLRKFETDVIFLEALSLALRRDRYVIYGLWGSCLYGSLKLLGGCELDHNCAQDSC